MPVSMAKLQNTLGMFHFEFASGIMAMNVRTMPTTVTIPPTIIRRSPGWLPVGSCSLMLKGYAVTKRRGVGHRGHSLHAAFTRHRYPGTTALPGG